MTKYFEQCRYGLLRDKTQLPGNAPTTPETVLEVVRLTHEPALHEATHRTSHAMAARMGLAPFTAQKI